MTTEAESGVMQPGAKECWQPLEEEEEGTDSPLEPLEGRNPTDTFIFADKIYFRL